MFFGIPASRVYAQEDGEDTQESDSSSGVEVVTPLDYAKLAVKYSWGTRAESVGNRGTALYQQLHDLAFPGDPYYASCDRSATTAIVASGADPSFPPGPCNRIVSYCDNSPLWNYIGDSSTVPYDQLQPGDVFVIGTYHTMLYVGYSVGGVGDTVEGSISRVWSPAVVNTIDKLYQRGGLEYGLGVPYRIYRMSSEAYPVKVDTGDTTVTQEVEQSTGVAEAYTSGNTGTIEEPVSSDNTQDDDEDEEGVVIKKRTVETATDRTITEEEAKAGKGEDSGGMLASEPKTMLKIEKSKVEATKTDAQKRQDTVTLLLALAGIGG